LTSEDYDMVIVLDTPDLERISYFYQEHPELFYRSVVVNIDHHPTNTYFGKINLVDLTATSTSEILIGLIEALEKEEKLIDKAVAQCLLAGIIGDTGSFQNSNTTPKSLTCAAQLLAAGADQQQIVQNLFRTKSLSTLRLWGRVLQQLQEDKEFRFVLGRANKVDFQESNAQEEEISGVIDELLRSLPDYDLVVLLSEKEKGVTGSLRAINPTVDCLEIAKAFGGGGHRGAAGFLVKEGNIEEVAQQVAAKVREYQAKRLGLNLAPNSTPPVISSEKPTS
jgi:phosphoesterase RecJ-like protein